jgi:hypothetical protein
MSGKMTILRRTATVGARKKSQTYLRLRVQKDDQILRIAPLLFSVGG